MLIVVKYLSALKQLKNQDTVVPPTPTSTLFELNVTEFNVRLIDWRVGKVKQIPNQGLHVSLTAKHFQVPS